MFNTVDELKEFLDTNGFERTSISGDYVMCLCPFHDDSNPSMGVHYKDGRAHCFFCGWFEFSEFSDKTGIEYSDNIDAMKDGEWNNIKNSFFKQEIKEDHIYYFKIPKECIDIIESDKHYEYMKARGFEKDTLIDFEVSVCKDKKSKYYNRIIIPIKDVTGRNMFFDARSIYDVKERKYIRPIHSPVKHSLFPIHKIKKVKYIALVEGVMDALKLKQLGINVVSMQGSNLSKFQIKMIMQRKFDDIWVGTDNDKRGNEARMEIIRDGLNSSCGMNVFEFRLGKRKDPAELNNLDEVFEANPRMKELYFAD
jgi:DNA primase